MGQFIHIIGADGRLTQSLPALKLGVGIGAVRPVKTARGVRVGLDFHG